VVANDARAENGGLDVELGIEVGVAEAHERRSEGGLHGGHLDRLREF
jgi:hypothetical protein